jgi:archaetidylinositol phosphate synthase
MYAVRLILLTLTYLMSAQSPTTPDDVRMNQTYAHQFARLLVRPLLGTPVRPNHITLLRLAVGLAACATLADGGRYSALWSGILWIIACVLDRADGELARLGNLRSELGKLLDFYSDLILDSAWFLAVGMAASRGALGSTGLALGIISCVSIAVCIAMAEIFERRSGEGVKTYYGTQQFHPDDALFLLPLFTWLGWQSALLALTSIVTPVLSVIITLRYVRLRSADPSLHT